MEDRVDHERKESKGNLLSEKPNESHAYKIPDISGHCELKGQEKDILT